MTLSLKDPGSLVNWQNYNELVRRYGAYLPLAGGVLTGIYRSVMAAATDFAYASRANGDTQARFARRIDGLMEWGPGGGTSRDTNLYRMSAGLLRTDHRIAAGEMGSKLTWHKIANQHFNNVASFTFANIPQDYKHLRMVMRLRSTDATAGGDAWHNVRLRINGDAAAKYHYAVHYISQAINTVSTARNDTSWIISLVPKAWWGDRYAYIELTIPYYRSYGAKGWVNNSHMLTTDDVDNRFVSGNGGGSSQILGAITSITGFLSTGNLAVSSEVDLYGGD